MEFYGATEDQCIYGGRDVFFGNETSLYSLPPVEYTFEREADSGVDLTVQDSLEAVADTLEVALADRVKTEITRFSGQLRHILEQQQTEYRHLLQSAKTSKVVDSNQYVSTLEYGEGSSTCNYSALSTQCILAEQFRDENPSQLKNALNKISRADGRLYDLRDHNGLSDLQVENQLSAGSMYHAENVDREDETWKCVVRMYVASGVVEKTLREAGLPEF